MRLIFGLLSTIAGIYSLLIFFRIIFSWFNGMIPGKPVEFLKKITDPYLDWWRRNLNLKVGFLDFSVVAAIVSLSLIQNILFTLSMSQRMTLGFILAEILLSVWTVFSFIIGFFIVVIILRAIGYLANQSIYSTFWSVVDSISQPVLYRMNRIFFGDGIGNYFKGIIFSLLLFFLIIFGGRILVNLLAGILRQLPI
jgi:YggT family protein